MNLPYPATAALVQPPAMDANNTSSSTKTFRPAISYSLLALAVTLFIFSPCLWLLARYHPGTFQWDRAHTFLLQCENPFRSDVESAMLWRLLPPIIAHGLGLRGYYPLVIPLVGVVVLLWYVFTVLFSRVADVRFAFGGTLLLAASSGVLVPLHWFGMNDAWVWFALLATGFSASRYTLPLACLLAPWIDERYIIGLPLALLVRFFDAGNTISLRVLVTSTLWLAPYAIIRLLGSFGSHASDALGFFLNHAKSGVLVTIPWAPLGWWMAFRLAWIPAIFAIRNKPWVLGLSCVITLIVMLLLAADISRSAAILSPVILLGLLLFAKQQPELAALYTLSLGLLNLLVPAAHVVSNRFALISPLPLEVWRLLR